MGKEQKGDDAQNKGRVCRYCGKKGQRKSECRKAKREGAVAAVETPGAATPSSASSARSTSSSAVQVITDHLASVPENYDWVLAVLSSETSSSEGEQPGKPHRRKRHVSFVSDPPDGYVDVWLDSGSQVHTCGYDFGKEFGIETAVPSRSMKDAQGNGINHYGRRVLKGIFCDINGDPVRSSINFEVSDVKYPILCRHAHQEGCVPQLREGQVRVHLPGPQHPSARAGRHLPGTTST